MFDNFITCHLATGCDHTDAPKRQKQTTSRISTQRLLQFSALVANHNKLRESLVFFIATKKFKCKKIRHLD